jgi:MFS superfamily sulfate permease-like transporter
VAVVLALVRFVRITSRPHAKVLGQVEGLPGFHAVARHPTVRTDPGLVLFRFNAPLVFFNAPYFKQQAQAAVAAAGPDLRWFVLDALPLTQVDVTGIDELEDLEQTLRERGAELVVAGRLTETDDWRKARKLSESDLAVRQFPTLRKAVQGYRAMRAERAEPGPPRT